MPRHADEMDALFQRVMRDEHHAFEAIFHQTYPRLCAYSNRLVRDPQLAEEIVDDVFSNVWNNRKRITINTSFQAYLVRAVRNRSLDYLRQMKQEKNRWVLELTENLPCRQSIASELMVVEELHDRIHAAVRVLPQQCRIIFQMSREQDLRYRDIARQLNISIKTVDTQINRALKHLRRALGS